MRRPSVIVVSSGMMEAGTLSYRIAKAMLPDPRHAIFFVGYVDPDAPGYRVMNARPGDRLPIGPGEDPVEVGCEVRRFHFSAHANRGQLLRLVEELNPSRVILTHGDAGALRWMAESIRDQYPWVEILTPEPGIPYDLPAPGK
jgi:predicted metal-dependent RNase